MFSFLERLSVRNRLWTIVAIFLASILAASTADVVLLRQSLLNERKQETRYLVDTARGVIAHFHDLEQQGRLARPEAQAAALAILKSLRYDSGQYFWVNDLGKPIPRMLMHPTVPSLDGQLLDSRDFNCATSLSFGTDGEAIATNGHRNLFSAMVEIADKSGSGYVTYDWPKPLPGGEVSTRPYPKLSYVEVFRPWGWMVGSGLYLDDVDRAVWEQMLRHGLQFALIAALLLLLASLIARSITRPLRETVEAMSRLDGTGNALGQRLPVKGSSEIGRLATGFNEMLDHLAARDRELARHREGLEQEVAQRTADLTRVNLALAAQLEERARVEEEIRESRRRMRALLDASGESVLLLEPGGSILTINTLGASRFGHTPEELVKTNFFDLLPPALAEARRAAVEQVADSGESMRLQDVRDGIHFDNHLYPVNNASGQVESIAVYAKDVTQQHRSHKLEEIFRDMDTMLLKWRMDLTAISQTFCNEIVPVFGLCAAWLGRAEEAGGFSILACTERGEDQKLFERLTADAGRLSTDCATAAGVLSSGKPRKILADDPGCRQCPASAASVQEARSIFMLPITVKGRTWGVLALYGPTAAQFDDAALAIQMSTMAHRMGVSVESALQQEWLTLLETALAGVGNAVLITDADTRILWANQAFCQLSGYAMEELSGQTPELFNSGTHDREFFRRYWETLTRGEAWHSDIVNRRKDGSLYTASQTVTPLLDTEGRISHFVSVQEDISERKAMEERIRHAATFDALTELPNRTLFFDRLQQALAIARREDQQGALLFLDLDHFKAVNDRLGHEAGDHVLQTVARRLQVLVRETDTVARLAGDEFTVILPHVKAPGDAELLADRITASLTRPMEFAEHTLQIGVNIGIALFPTQGGDAEGVLKAADTAMYKAKAVGRKPMGGLGVS